MDKLGISIVIGIALGCGAFAAAAAGPTSGETSKDACERALTADEIAKRSTAFRALIQAARSVRDSIFAEQPAALVELFPTQAGGLTRYYSKAVQYLYEKDNRLGSLQALLSQYKTWEDFRSDRIWLRVRVFALAVKQGLDYDYGDDRISTYEIEQMEKAFAEYDINHTLFFRKPYWERLPGKIVLIAKTVPGARSLIRPDGPLGRFWKGRVTAIYKASFYNERYELSRAFDSELDTSPKSQRELSQWSARFVRSASFGSRPNLPVIRGPFPKTGVIEGKVDLDLIPDHPYTITPENVAQLENSLRRGSYQGDEYLAWNESYSSRVQLDLAKTRELDTSPTAQASWLRDLLKLIESKDRAEIINYAGQEFVSRRMGPGGSRSHYGDDFGWGPYYQIVNLNNGESQWFSAGNVYMIGFYGFYGGVNNRISPDGIERLRNGPKVVGN